MNTKDGPSDTEPVTNDKQDQFMAICNDLKLEGVDLKVNRGPSTGQVSATIRRMVASLTHKAQFMAYILGRSARHS